MQNTDLASLTRIAWRRTIVFIAALWFLIFVPALTLDYWQGWLFWVVYSLCCIAPTAYFLRHDPALIERRMKVGPAAETEPTQKLIQVGASVVTIAMFVLPGIDHLRGWSHVPWPIVILGNALVILGFVIMCWVFRENSFAAATIQVEAEQRVISTGPYAIVRHPMYFGALLMFAGIPLALGSWWTMWLLAPLIAMLALRLVNEERFLARELPGYPAYRQSVRFRLLPGIW